MRGRWITGIVSGIVAVGVGMFWIWHPPHLRAQASSKKILLVEKTVAITEVLSANQPGTMVLPWALTGVKRIPKNSLDLSSLLHGAVGVALSISRPSQVSVTGFHITAHGMVGQDTAYIPVYVTISGRHPGIWSQSHGIVDARFVLNGNPISPHPYKTGSWTIRVVKSLTNPLAIQQSSLGELFPNSSPSPMPYQLQLKNTTNRSVMLSQLTIDGPVYHFRSVRYRRYSHSSWHTWPQAGIDLTPSQSLSISAQLVFDREFHGWGYATPYLKLNGGRALQALTPMEFSAGHTPSNEWSQIAIMR